jgi:hypothetical protein
MFLIPWIAGASVATVLASTVLTLPAVVALRTVVRRRAAAPLVRDVLERNLVLASTLLGGASAVAWSDLGGNAGGDFAFLLLGFVAPVPLASVPWFAGEALSGASQHPWRSLIGAACAASVVSWVAYALCWSSGWHRLSPETILIELAQAIVASFAAAQAYLATRGPARASLCSAVLALEDA